MKPNNSPGTYVLCFQSRVDRQVTIGRFGRLLLRSGFYLYVGSAHGPGGLRARVDRHRRRDKRKRWHIDYLRPHVRLLEIWFGYSENRMEGRWSACITALDAAEIAMPGFGASDCQGEEHLLYFSDVPDYNRFQECCDDGALVNREIVGAPL